MQIKVNKLVMNITHLFIICDFFISNSFISKKHYRSKVLHVDIHLLITREVSMRK